MLHEILTCNKHFVESKTYENFSTCDKFPAKKLAIVSCMDTRLTELLPAALGIKNGDAKLIQNAGGVISHPFGSVMRSLLIAVFELGVQEILVIGHTDCGARFTDSQAMQTKMLAQGITQENIDMVKYCGIDFNAWLGGFMDLEQSVRKSTELVKHHPLIPAHVKVYGLIIDSQTGELIQIV